MDHKKKGKKELHVTYLTTLQWKSAQAPQRQYSLHPVMLRTTEVAQSHLTRFAGWVPTKIERKKSVNTISIN
jgi:hypothetical protein